MHPSYVTISSKQMETGMAEIVGAHNELHSEQGALHGEHPGRSLNPVIKVADLAWLEFDKPDLSRAAAFARAFGFTTSATNPTQLHLRGSDAGAPCVIIRQGPQTRFRGLAFRAEDESDLRHLADRTGAAPAPLPDDIGGQVVSLVDPNGTPVKVVAGLHELPALPAQQPHVFNLGHELNRANATQRPPREPAGVQRLGHVVLSSTTYIETLNWYLTTSG